MAKNPQRFRQRQIQPQCDEPLPPRPADWVERSEWSQEAILLLAAWDDFAKRLALLGLGCAVDDLILRLACQMRVRAERSGAKVAEIREYRAMLNELGLTEAGRARMGAPLEHGDDEYGDFGQYRKHSVRRTA